MLVIGIAGGVGSGKSSVAEHLASLGAASLDADQIGHDVLDEVEVKDRLVGRWGASITGTSGEIDRAAVSKIVFGETLEALNELSFLEELIHPRIARRLEKRIEELEQTEEFKILVLDAAVMFKAGWDRFCDKFVFVEAGEPERSSRCQQRGWTAEEFRYREANQELLGLKRSRADWIVDNSGTPEQALDQLTEIWNELVKLS
ncbi:MAG TPA: dephospho-CoA kinase [Planctomycetaceae bacterium]|nr:dephospho-CoA kinase [Planctomycetaceae bacterium]